MMYILRKINKYITYICFTLLLVSCRIFVPMEPVYDTNERFLARYKNLINKAKNNHKIAMDNQKDKVTVEFSKTAYGKIVMRELEFKKINAKNNPYVMYKRAGGENIQYLNYNAIAYNENRKGYFDNIEIPEYDFKYYYLGDKHWYEINNIELQEAYDYIYVINDEKIKQSEIERIRQELLEQEKYKNSSLLDKSRMGLKNLSNRIRSLLK